MNLSLVLSSIDHNGYFLKKYVAFIHKFNGVYVDDRYETHHICPKALFPEFECLKQHTWNSAELSPRAHYIAHKILVKVFPTSKEMIYAFWCMSNSFKTSEQYRDYKISSKQYSEIKDKISELQSIRLKENNPWKDQSVKEKAWETIITIYGGLGNSSQTIHDKQKKTMLDTYGVDNIFKYPDFIKQNSEQCSLRWADEEYKKSTSAAIREALASIDRSGENNSFYDKTHSEESRRKISDSKSGVPHIRFSCLNCRFELGVNNSTKHFRSCKGTKITSVVCPHCGKEGKPGSNMNRWHFDNCKHKED
jgi:hypothetical protein